jgi:transposase
MEAMGKAVHGEKVVEVTEKARRRQHSAAYKQKILQEADACTKSGELGALLRREGLYSSLLANWRKARATGGRDGLEAKRRGPQPKVPNPLNQKLAEQERELARWKARAELAEALVEIQKKLRRCWGPNSRRPAGSANGYRD